MGAARLTDSGDEQRLIRTLPRKGIRFVGAVREEQVPMEAAVNDPVPLPKPALPLPDKPSVAVLPFSNMSGDPEQDYFADGIPTKSSTSCRVLRAVRHRPQLEIQFKGKSR